MFVFLFRKMVRTFGQKCCQALETDRMLVEAIYIYYNFLFYIFLKFIINCELIRLSVSRDYGRFCCDTSPDVFDTSGAEEALQ